MTLAQVLAHVPQWLDLAGLIMTGIVLLATVLARLAAALDSVKPNAIDPLKVVEAKSVVAKAANWLADAMHYFPTLGKNPRTVQLEALLSDIQANQETAPIGLILTTIEQAVQGPQAPVVAKPDDNAKTAS
jgi:hypothetical protein